MWIRAEIVALPARRTVGGCRYDGPGVFALVVRFNLRPGTEDDFDRLVEETTARIRSDEPGTLLYLCHRVQSEPTARVFYELYRDDEAFKTHEVAGHVKEFHARRRPLRSAA